MIKLFKLFETRTAGLSEEEFRELLQKNCRDYIDNPKLLQRNKSRNDGDYSYINPSVNTRTSLISDDGVSGNHHTLLMDNLPSWKRFPKRSKSIIGLTNVFNRNVFGNVNYLVIPYDNANFGVAPSMDLWSCKTRVIYSSYISFNEELSYAFVSNGISDSSYEQMISDLEELYEKWLKNKTGFLSSIFEYINQNNLSIVEGLDKILLPENFKGTDLDDLEGFNVMNYNMLANIDEDGEYEFWTDSKCLLYLVGTNMKKDDIRISFEKFKSEYL